jgi:hypothetical protein
MSLMSKSLKVSEYCLLLMIWICYFAKRYMFASLVVILCSTRRLLLSDVLPSYQEYCYRIRRIANIATVGSLFLGPKLCRLMCFNMYHHTWWVMLRHVGTASVVYKYRWCEIQVWSSILSFVKRQFTHIVSSISLMWYFPALHWYTMLQIDKVPDASFYSNI